MSAALQLRTATRSAHQRLEKRLDIKSLFSDLPRYRRHLERMWGYYAVREQTLDPASFAGALADYDSRRKLPLLTDDLLALGSTLQAIKSLRTCGNVPPVTDAASAFGSAYVLEGATLGGRSLLSLVERQLTLPAGRGSAFLASYGASTADMWAKFSAALDRWCCTPDREAAAAAAAVATFETLETWLCEPPS